MLAGQVDLHFGRFQGALSLCVDSQRSRYWVTLGREIVDLREVQHGVVDRDLITAVGRAKLSIPADIPGRGGDIEVRKKAIVGAMYLRRDASNRLAP